MKKYQKYLVEKLAKKLKSKKWTIVTAESCTAGGVAFHFSSCPSASPLLERGYIVYSDDSKIQALGVNKKTIQKYGPVSSEVAKEMAEGGLKFSQAQLSLAITGLAGPKGDETNTPVGTIWFGLAGKNKKTITLVNFFKGSRQNVLNKSIEKGLEHTINFINNKLT